MSLARSIYLLVISLMQSVNETQFLNITFLFLLLGFAAVPVFGTVIVMYSYVHVTIITKT